MVALCNSANSGGTQNCDAKAGKDGGNCPYAENKVASGNLKSMLGKEEATTRSQFKGGRGGFAMNNEGRAAEALNKARPNWNRRSGLCKRRRPTRTTDESNELTKVARDLESSIVHDSANSAKKKCLVHVVDATNGCTWTQGQAGFCICYEAAVENGDRDRHNTMFITTLLTAARELGRLERIAAAATMEARLISSLATTTHLQREARERTQEKRQQAQAEAQASDVRGRDTEEDANTGEKGRKASRGPHPAEERTRTHSEGKRRRRVARRTRAGNRDTSVHGKRGTIRAERRNTKIAQHPKNRRTVEKIKPGKASC
ncbi:hypothetical protein TRVL_04260 [Trypanosoma vivax]|nr:hypothetical protein TRVL_04260 [Trypanosoma vivax]